MRITSKSENSTKPVVLVGACAFADIYYMLTWPFPRPYFSYNDYNIIVNRYGYTCNFISQVYSICSYRILFFSFAVIYFVVYSLQFQFIVNSSESNSPLTLIV